MTLPALISKLETAEGGSRELDAAVAAALRIGPVSNPSGWVTHWTGPFVPHPKFPGKVALAHTDGALGMHWNAPAYTTSVDAALALIGERLPGWCGPISLTIAGSAQAYIEASDPCERRDVQAFGPQLALALCLALCLALQSQDTPNEG